MTETQSTHPALALTARWTASARAQESARPDPLFMDPWAAALAGEEGAAWLAQQGGRVSPMVVRTHYFDRFLQDAAQRGLRQVVLLAAGLDTRAYRLPWPPETRLFELDQPAVLAHKAQTLNAAGARPACQRSAIPADLTGPWPNWLCEGGFDPRQPTAWLLEGFLYYLPDPALERILGQVSALAAPGSRIGFDIINHLTLTSPITRAWIEMQARSGSPWLGALDDPEAFLAAQGWQSALTQPGAPDANFERWTLPVIALRAPNLPHNWYVTASKD